MSDETKDVDKVIAEQINKRQAEIDAFKKLLDELSKKRKSKIASKVYKNK